MSYLASGLSMAGLSIHRLPDWELLALYAGYLRPELSERAGLAARREMVGGTSGSFLGGGPPLTSAEFVGGLSSSVITSRVPASPQYKTAIDSLAPAAAAASPPNNSSVANPEQGQPSLATLNISRTLNQHNL